MATSKAIKFFRKYIDQGYPDFLSESTEVAKAMPVYVAQLESEQTGRSKGGKAEKIKKGILHATLEYMHKHPGSTDQILWDIMPNSRVEYRPNNFPEYLVYRDEDTLVQVNDGTGKEQSIPYNTFRTYCTKARKIIADE